MRRSLLLLAASLSALGAPLAAQSSQFGVRGLGLPGRGLSAKALGTGGGIGMFEGESSRNPAALSLLSSATTTFTGTNTWRTSVNEAGGGSTFDTRFPQLSVGGPVPGTKFWVGVSNSLFTNRDFTVVSTGVAVPRLEAVQFTDSLASRGGINNLRLAVAYRVGKTLAIGGGFDILTGQDRLTTRRVWEDTNYRATQLTSDLSYRGVGVTLGALYRATPRWQFAGAMQLLGSLDVDKDSANANTVRMPMTLSGAVRGALRRNIEVSGMAVARNWSRSSADLVANGGTGAQNTVELSGGLELIRNLKAPDNFPLRLGVRRADLPFPLRPGEKVTEIGFSMGSGLRFANQAGGIDFALERATRKQGSLYSETAWLLTIGITVRAGGGGR